MRERPLLCVNDIDPKIHFFFGFQKSKMCSFADTLNNIDPQFILIAFWIGRHIPLGPMAKTVADALTRAAERAKRRAELETAWLMVERGLGHQLAPDEFGWFSVVPHVLR